MIPSETPNFTQPLDSYEIIEANEMGSPTREVEIDNGVISSLGVVGIIDKISPNYSRFISILNTNFLLNAKFKKSNYFGVLSWNGININKVQLKDVPKQANVSIGDTIVTVGNWVIWCN